VGAGDAIGRAERGAHADGHRLFADVRMHRAVDPLGLPKLDGEQVELADQDQLAKDLDQLGLGQ